MLNRRRRRRRSAAATRAPGLGQLRPLLFRAGLRAAQRERPLAAGAAVYACQDWHEQLRWPRPEREGRVSVALLALLAAAAAAPAHPAVAERVRRPVAGARHPDTGELEIRGFAILGHVARVCEPLRASHGSALPAAVGAAEVSEDIDARCPAAQWGLLLHQAFKFGRCRSSCLSSFDWFGRRARKRRGAGCYTPRPQAHSVRLPPLPCRGVDVAPAAAGPRCLRELSALCPGATPCRERAACAEGRAHGVGRRVGTFRAARPAGPELGAAAVLQPQHQCWPG
mmetsp:Transcript_119608/g.381665  ORF Transcript_119608/g.381665 Transcript_119608/m.381665 type:complete len:283 (+) Transcript_119608:1275-2123(+)